MNMKMDLKLKAHRVLFDEYIGSSIKTFPQDDDNAFIYMSGESDKGVVTCMSGSYCSLGSMFFLMSKDNDIFKQLLIDVFDRLNDKEV